MFSREPAKPDLSRRATWVALAVVLVLGSAVRLYHLGQKELWLDESVSALAVERAPGEVGAGRPRPLAETVEKVGQHDAHPPLYYVALNVTARLAGRDEAGLRRLSAVAGIGGILLTYAVGAALLGRSVGVLAAAGMAFSSFQVYFAQEARLHALVTLLVLAETWVFVRMVRARRASPGALWPWLVAYGLLAAALLYTYYYAVFALAAHAAAFCALWFGARIVRDESGERWLLTPRRAEALWPMLLAAATLGGVLFAVGWGDRLLERLAGTAVVPSTPYTLAGVAGALRAFLAGPPVERLLPRLDGGTVVTVGGLVLLPLAGVACSLRRAPGAAAVLLLWLIVPLAGVALVPRPHVFEAKHVVFVAPALYLMAASAWAWPRARRLVVVVFGLLALLNAAALRVYFRPDYHKEPWREVVRRIRAGEQQGEVIVASPAYAAHPLRRYYRGRLRILGVEGTASLRRLAAMAPAGVWLVELRSRVACPSIEVERWLAARGVFPKGIPATWELEGFTTFPTRILLRRIRYRPAGGG